MNGFFYGYKLAENSPIFIRTTGKPLLPDSMTHASKKLVMSIGIDDVWSMTSDIPTPPLCWAKMFLQKLSKKDCGMPG